MLATILKSKQAITATVIIIETFARIRELTSNIYALHKQPTPKKQKDLLAKSGQILSNILDENIPCHESETSVELNFAVVKFKHTIKNHQPANG